MARSLLVNGTASIASGTGGAGALEELGISVDGVEISVTEFYDPIFADMYGPEMPFDYQYNGQLWEIGVELVYFDVSVLNKWLTGQPSGSLTLGGLGNVGELMVANTKTARLLIRSTPSGTGLSGQATCWNFLRAFLLPSSGNFGTRKTTWKGRFRAVPDQQTASSAATIFNTTCV